MGDGSIPEARFSRRPLPQGGAAHPPPKADQQGENPNGTFGGGGNEEGVREPLRNKANQNAEELPRPSGEALASIKELRDLSLSGAREKPKVTGAEKVNTPPRGRRNDPKRALDVISVDGDEGNFRLKGNFFGHGREEGRVVNRPLAPTARPSITPPLKRGSRIRGAGLLQGSAPKRGLDRAKGGTPKEDTHLVSGHVLKPLAIGLAAVSQSSFLRDEGKIPSLGAHHPKGNGGQILKTRKLAPPGRKVEAREGVVPLMGPAVPMGRNGGQEKGPLSSGALHRNQEVAQQPRKGSPPERPLGAPSGMTLAVNGGLAPHTPTKARGTPAVKGPTLARESMLLTPILLRSLDPNRIASAKQRSGPRGESKG